MLLVTAAVIAASPFQSFARTATGSLTGDTDITGRLTDGNSRGIKGVVVTDGYRCAVTDGQGNYRLKGDPRAKFVFYSAPRGYVTTSTAFYRRLMQGENRYDFTLEKSAQNDRHFYLLGIGDPQIRSKETLNRFDNEGMAELRKFVAESKLPVVGLSMGDNTHEECSVFEQPISQMLHSTAMALYATPGNHDYFKVDGSIVTPRTCTPFEDAFGPTWYSFNKGDAHVICLNNVQYSSGKKYKGGFTDEQIAWMKQDLSYVPKNRLVVVFYHIPVRDDQGFANRDNMLRLLEPYKHRILMCGHTHYMCNYITKAPVRVEERIHAASCGVFWNSTINGDGTPNGFSVYEVKGNRIVNNYYQSVNRPRDYQIRLFRGNATFGGEHGTYGFNLPADCIVANVWNWDYRWHVYCYEDGRLSGEMACTLPMIKDDPWSNGYHVGVKNKKPKDFVKFTMHNFFFKLKNPNAKVEVVAVDGFGNRYVQSQFTTDMREAEGYGN